MSVTTSTEPGASASGVGRPAAAVADPPGIDAWRMFLVAHARITRRLDDELQAAHGLSLAEYDALLQIATAPNRRVRMNVLAERVILSRSGITRLVDRLEAQGAVERIACATDARGQEARLTSAGLERLRGAARTHLDGVHRYFLDRLGPAELAALGSSLEAVAAPLSTGGPLAREGCEPGTA
jgi:DNA-binding MarR family transcriptional regulator